MNRRFSKTLGHQFGHRSQVLVDNLIKKEIKEIAIEVAQNGKTESTSYN